MVSLRFLPFVSTVFDFLLQVDKKRLCCDRRISFVTVDAVRIFGGITGT